MNIKCSTPKSKASCIYKLSFPDGSFYIGSTTNFRQRLSGYKSSFKNSIGSVNKLIAAKANEFDVVFFDIMYVVQEHEELRCVENEYIKSSIGNPLLLNRSTSAFNNSGMIKSR